MANSRWLTCLPAAVSLLFITLGSPPSGKKAFPISEAPGVSVFYKGYNGDVLHTCSTYARGLEVFNGAYHLLDLTTKGRNEDELDFTLAWVCHHDQYE